MKKSIYLLFLALFCFSAQGTLPSPEDTVREATEEVLRWLESERDELRADPEYLRILVEELIVPHFDFRTMSRLVLEQHWWQIDEAERTCFARGFRNLLVERYAAILLSYNNHVITYDPAVSIGELGYMSVRQTISRDGAKPLPIEYPMRPDDQGWRVVDLIVDGVSLLVSYRQTFHDEIKTQGLDGFIHSFPDCNTEPDPDTSSRTANPGSPLLADS